MIVGKLPACQLSVRAPWCGLLGDRSHLGPPSAGSLGTGHISDLLECGLPGDRSHLGPPRVRALGGKVPSEVFREGAAQENPSKSAETPKERDNEAAYQAAQTQSPPVPRCQCYDKKRTQVFLGVQDVQMA
jgi:hypothetical protein